MLIWSTIIVTGVLTALSCLLPPATTGNPKHQQRFSSKYEKPAMYGGLFYVVGSSDNVEERSVVISYDDKPIEAKANDPDAPTIPGFYLSNKQRYDFERIEVIESSVYFKTHIIEGVSFEFSGTLGEEIVPTFDPSIAVPFIKGALTTVRNGKVVKKEEIMFGHAVVV